MLVRLVLITSGDLPALASQIAGITDMSHHARPFLSLSLSLIIINILVTGSCYVAKANLKLLSSRDHPKSASQSAEIIGVSYCIRPLTNVSIVHSNSLSDYHSEEDTQDNMSIWCFIFLPIVVFYVL